MELKVVNAGRQSRELARAPLHSVAHAALSPSSRAKCQHFISSSAGPTILPSQPQGG